MCKGEKEIFFGKDRKRPFGGKGGMEKRGKKNEEILSIFNGCGNIVV